MNRSTDASKRKARWKAKFTDEDGAQAGRLIIIIITKTMAFNNQKIVINNSTSEQVSPFKYLGCAVSYKPEYDIRQKIHKFMNICGTIYRNIKNITKHSTRIKFYKTIAIPTSIYESEAWVMKKKESGKIQSA